jgi:hypothetical protein
MINDPLEVYVSCLLEGMALVFNNQTNSSQLDHVFQTCTPVARIATTAVRARASRGRWEFTVLIGVTAALGRSRSAGRIATMAARAHESRGRRGLIELERPPLPIRSSQAEDVLRT